MTEKKCEPQCSTLLCDLLLCGFHDVMAITILGAGPVIRTKTVSSARHNLFFSHKKVKQKNFVALEKKGLGFGIIIIIIASLYVIYVTYVINLLKI